MMAEALDIFRCELSGMSLIEASAGTGKTWNICALFMRLLLQRRIDIARILVVTYTNAATAELRERIRARITETLAHLQGAPAAAGDEFVGDLLATLPTDPAAMADLKACLEQALQRFDEAAIFTIHGYCERALRDMPLGSGMPMSMELITDDSPLCTEVARDFWRRRIAAGDLAPGLAAFMVDARDTPEKLAGLLRERLARPLAKMLWPDDADSRQQAGLDLLQRTFAEARAIWLRDRRAILAIVMEALPRLNAGSYKRERVQAAAAEWDEFFVAGNPYRHPAKGEKLHLFSSGKLTPNKGKAPPGHHDFFGLAETLLDQRHAARQTLRILRCQLLRALLEGGPEELGLAKRARRVMSFNDLLANLYGRVTGAEYPWLAPLLRSRFPAALIDEFQDTDPVQFGIFRAIYSAPDTTLFLVGDPKQAIYSFRGADLRVYLQAKNASTRVFTLAANQRCSHALLSALNALFGHRAQEFMVGGLEYAPLTFGRKPRAILIDRTEARAPLQLWNLPRADATTLLTKTEAKSRAALACAAEIARLLAEGQRGHITLDGKALRAADIAVLVRTHKEALQMREALERLSVGSVELSRTSIFKSAEARELERILAAICEPLNAPRVRAARATVVLGGNAAAIDASSGDDLAMFQAMMQFADYHDRWLAQGAGVMLRQLTIQEKIGARLLSLPFGERRLTNWLHLLEILHAADVQRATPEVLLAWLQARLSKDTPDETGELRLESDRNLVQVVTIHRAKGLEYPIVFCPFAWDGYLGRPATLSYGCEHRDGDSALVMDFRILPDDDMARYQRENAAERLEEGLRMTYVALTRAQHRCYLVVGCYSGKSRGVIGKECRGAPLTWFAAGAGMDRALWPENKLTPDEIDAAWQTLAERCKDADDHKPAIGYAALPSLAGVPLLAQRAAPQSIEILTPPARIAPGWRLGSYSQLIHGASGERAAVDHDLRASFGHVADQEPSDAAAPEDILRFPRGILAGHCIHAVFERADFVRPETWGLSIEQALRDYPQTPRRGDTPAQLPAMLANMLNDVLHTPLPGGFRLAEVPRTRRLSELKFSLPAAHIQPSVLNNLLARDGFAIPALIFPDLRGYLNGAIDLVFEIGGQYWILDWKSNFLGATAAHYEAAPLASVMDQQYYHLQYLLYATALHRLLQRRLPAYAYERHFGGILYLFVRGVRPRWRGQDGNATGVFAAHPPERLIEALSALMSRARSAA